MRSDPPRKTTPSEREWEVLDALWDLGSGTVAEVRRRLNDVREVDLAHTTVATNLLALRAKGWVTRSPEGTAHRYAPVATRGQGRSEAIGALLDSLFEGSSAVLVDSLVRDCQLRLRAVHRLRDIVDRRLKEMER
jgi:BlaI family transcriptional regulator, penicillinase repressor